MKATEDFIEVVEGGVPSGLVDMVLEEYSGCSDWHSAETTGLLEDYRVCSRIGISLSSVIGHSQTRKDIDSRLFQTFGTLMGDYIPKHGSTTLYNDSGYDLLRYTPGGKYEFHVDEVKDLKRTMTLIACLSEKDSYVGGELEFLDGPQFHLGRGDVIMFPSNFIYRHRILPVTEGTRYSIVTWFF
jgi:hypothetical protein